MKDNVFERYAKNNEYLEYLKEFDKELSSNSDRGVVLVCGSIIDTMLQILLKDFLIDSEKIEKEIFTPKGTLGTFDAKIKMAYYLGLISIGDKRLLEIIQKVRNKFAHAVGNISFDNNQIADLCSNIKLPKNSFVPNVIPFQNKGDNTLPKVDLNPIKKDTPAKQKFIIIFKYLYQSIINRAFFDKFEKRTEFKDMITADKIIEKQIQTNEKVIKNYDKQIVKLENMLESTQNKIEELQNDLKSRATETGNQEIINEIEKKIDYAKESKVEIETLLDDAYNNVDSFYTIIQKISPIQKYTLEVVRNSMK